MDGIEMLKGRRSVRAYRAGAIPRKVLEEMVDCARLAPTAMNQQAWEFVVITDANTMAAIQEKLGHAQFLKQAGACIAVLCRENQFYVEDGSAATQNLMLAGWAHGLGTCWIAGDKQAYAEGIREFLGAPAGYKLFSLVSVGYPGEEPKPEKRPLPSLLHWERF